MSPIKIFYARSSHTETTTLVFNSIYEYFLRNKDLNVDILELKIVLSFWNA
jgi:hypothetical protein